MITENFKQSKRSLLSRMVTQNSACSLNNSRGRNFSYNDGSDRSEESYYLWKDKINSEKSKFCNISKLNSSHKANKKILSSEKNIQKKLNFKRNVFQRTKVLTNTSKLLDFEGRNMEKSNLFSQNNKDNRFSSSSLIKVKKGFKSMDLSSLKVKKSVEFVNGIHLQPEINKSSKFLMSPKKSKKISLTGNKEIRSNNFINLKVGDVGEDIPKIKISSVQHSPLLQQKRNKPNNIFFSDQFSNKKIHFSSDLKTLNIFKKINKREARADKPIKFASNEKLDIIQKRDTFILEQNTKSKNNQKLSANGKKRFSFSQTLHDKKAVHSRTYSINTIDCSNSRKDKIKVKNPKKINYRVKARLTKSPSMPTQVLSRPHTPKKRIRKLSQPNISLSPSKRLSNKNLLRRKVLLGHQKLKHKYMMYI